MVHIVICSWILMMNSKVPPALVPRTANESPSIQRRKDYLSSLKNNTLFEGLPDRRRTTTTRASSSAQMLGIRLCLYKHQCDTLMMKAC